MANPKFGNRNELSAYQIGKDIANLEVKVELLEKTKGGVSGGEIDVLKVIVPAATDEDFEKKSLCVVQLPEDFQNSLVLMFINGSWNYVTTEDDLGVGLSSYETEIFIIKITDFKNPKDTVHAVFRTVGGSGAAASDA